jgi:hypothetical protein
MADQTPKKHHYIPCFYLKRWAGADGRLCEFSRPYQNTVKPKRVHPAATGYVERLYSLKGFAEEHAHQIEERFFRPADSLANDALTKLENGGIDVPWSSQLRSAWSRFLLSLLTRCPEDIERFRIYWRKLLTSTNDQEEEEYRLQRSDDEPSTFAELMAAMTIQEFEESFFRLLIGLIDNAKIGNDFNGLRWNVIDTAASRLELLTSDRPVSRPVLLGDPDGRLLLPIGPTRLFIAARDDRYARSLKHVPSEKIVRETNEHVVGAAVTYVYGSNDAQLRFVQNRFGRTPDVRMLDDAIETGEQRLPTNRNTNATTEGKPL